MFCRIFVLIKIHMNVCCILSTLEFRGAGANSQITGVTARGERACIAASVGARAQLQIFSGAPFL